MKDEYEIQRAYTHTQQDISTLIDWLECELEQQPDDINWGHVGSLKHVRSNLLETLSFVSGFDQKGLEKELEECNYDIRQPKRYKDYETDVQSLVERVGGLQQECNLSVREGRLEEAQEYERNVKHLTDVLNFVQSDDHKSAYSCLQGLDDALKREVPPKLYEYLLIVNKYP